MQPVQKVCGPLQNQRLPEGDGHDCLVDLQERQTDHLKGAETGDVIIAGARTGEGGISQGINRSDLEVDGVNAVSRSRE